MKDLRCSEFEEMLMLHIAETAPTQIVPPVLSDLPPIVGQASDKALITEIYINIQILILYIHNLFYVITIIPDLFSAIYKLM